MKTLAAPVAIATLVLLANVSPAQIRPIHPRTGYVIQDLSVGSPFPDAFAYGVSRNGRITGVGTDPNTNELHAFMWQNGTFQDLGTLGYPYGADGIAINDSGQVAATGYGPGYNALLYSNGTVTQIGNIDGHSSQGLSINSSGHIVGRAIGDDGGGQGFTYIGGQFTPIGVDRAACINDADQFVGSVGYYWVQGGYMHGVEHAFIGTGTSITDIGNIGGGVRTATEAYGINNAGDVTGYSTAADGTVHAFLYSGGAMSDLGTFPPYYTVGIAINGSGQVAGNITTAYGGQIGVFLYSGGAMHDLSDLLGGRGAAWSGMIACGMNDAGWIVGYGTVNGATHGYLARPVLLP